MRTLIISGGRFDEEFAVSFLEENKYDYIIAVDGGVDYAERMGVIPNLIVGDFDTFTTDGLSEYERRGVIIRRFNPEKDDTDTEIAVREAVMLGNDTDIIGATGGRIDHLLANIHNMKIALDAGVNMRLVDEGNIIYLKDRDFTIATKDCRGKYISFVPFSGEVTGMYLEGFKYPLNDYTLKPGASRCVSNELAADYGVVKIGAGCLIVINSRDVSKK